MENTKPEEMHKTDLQLLYELADLHGRHVQFDEMGFEGPADRRIFQIEVCVGDLRGYGCGLTKQKAKLHAATDVMKGLMNLPVPENATPYWCKPQNDLVDPVDRPFFFHNKDPVSALVEVLMVRKQQAPEFKVVKFYHLYDRNMFCVEVRVGQMTCQAEDSSKKGAKAMAAEKMLEMMGFKEQIQNQNPPMQPFEQVLFQQQIYQHQALQKQQRAHSKPTHQSRPVQVPEELRPVQVPEEPRPAQVQEEARPAQVKEELRPVQVQEELRPVQIPDEPKPEQPSARQDVNPTESVRSTEDPTVPEEIKPVVSIIEQTEAPSGSEDVPEAVVPSSPEALSSLTSEKQEDSLSEFIQPDLAPEESSPKKCSPEEISTERSVEPESEGKGQCAEATHCMIAAMIKKLVTKAHRFPDPAQQMTLVQRLRKVENQVLIPEDSELRAKDFKAIGKAAAKSLLQEIGSPSSLFSESDHGFIEATVKHLNIHLKAFLTHPPKSGRAHFFSRVCKIFRRNRIPAGPLNTYLSS